MTPARELASRLGLPFKDFSLLDQALVHSSYVHEQPSIGASNERLEFLGDAVISIVVSEALWQRYPEDDEGSLTTRRAAIVSARGLSRIAQRLDLGSYPTRSLPVWASPMTWDRRARSSCWAASGTSMTS
jgi:dsRNA-specific ribonuclease